MTRINRPDTLLTELREIQRRLRLLEGASARVAAALTLAGAVAAPAPVSLPPARSTDWPATTSEEWEGLVRTLAVPELAGARLVIDAVAEPDTTGLVRVVAAGEPIAGELSVTSEVSRHTVDLPAVVDGDRAEIVVQARRVDGDGAVRATAMLLPPA
jgi:hypothetical protein